MLPRCNKKVESKLEAELVINCAKAQLDFDYENQ